MLEIVIVFDVFRATSIDVLCTATCAKLTLIRRDSSEETADVVPWLTRGANMLKAGSYSLLPFRIKVEGIDSVSAQSKCQDVSEKWEKIVLKLTTPIVEQSAASSSAELPKAELKRPTKPKKIIPPITPAGQIEQIEQAVAQARLKALQQADTTDANIGIYSGEDEKNMSDVERAKRINLLVSKTRQMVITKRANPSFMDGTVNGILKAHNYIKSVCSCPTESVEILESVRKQLAAASL